MRHAIHTFNVPSESQSNLHYTIILWSDGQLECSCKDYQYRGPQCKHVRDYNLAIFGLATGPVQGKLVEKKSK